MRLILKELINLLYGNNKIKVLWLLLMLEMNIKNHLLKKVMEIYLVQQ